MIKDPFKVNMGIDLIMRRVEAQPIGVFRTFVWDTFTRILRQTPQWSGKAVANWNIGVGAPDFSYDPGVGDTIDLWGTNVLRKGHHRWIEYAKRRNAPKIKKIAWTSGQRPPKVFISNGVEGDDDGGKASSELYLEALQDPGYWMMKLREANKPYETAAESVVWAGDRYLAQGKLPAAISGDSWERYV